MRDDDQRDDIGRLMLVVIHSELQYVLLLAGCPTARDSARDPCLFLRSIGQVGCLESLQALARMCSFGQARALFMNSVDTHTACRWA